MRNDTITVRDRRKPRQFSIDNVVMDQWLPIIGETGFAFYSLLVRLARKGEEKSFPGYTLISGHLGIARSTVSAYAKLLTFCGLVHVVAGNTHRSNTYYILEPPEVTPERLELILLKVQGAWPENNSYRKTFEKRIKAWKSLQQHFKTANAETNAHEKQLALFEPSLAIEHPSATTRPASLAIEHPSATTRLASATTGLEQSKFNNPNRTIQMEQSKFVVVGCDPIQGRELSFFEKFTRARARVESSDLASAFDEAGIIGEATRRAILMGNPDVTPEDVRAWAAYRDEENRRRPGSCSTAVIIAYLRSGQRPPERFYNQLDEYQITVHE